MLVSVDVGMERNGGLGDWTYRGRPWCESRREERESVALRWDVGISKGNIGGYDVADVCCCEITT